MKKLLFWITLLFYITLFVSCGKVEEEAVSTPTLNIPLQQKIEDNNIILYTLATGLIKENEKNTWCQYIEETFGYDIELHITAFSPKQYSQMLENNQDNYGRMTAEKIRENKYGGIFYLGGSSALVLQALVVDKAILPLNEYLRDNDFLNNVPEDILNNFMITGDDTIWAIPFSFEPALVARQYNKTWLDKFNYEVPSTTDELYEVLKSFTYDDPNNNKQNDTIGAWYNAEVPNRYFTDILNAFGCTISRNKYDVSTIYYDFEQERYADSMRGPNISTALNYIQHINNAGLLTIYNSESCGCQLRYNLRNFDPDMYEYGFCLTGTKKDSITPISYGYLDGYYVLSSKTENPRSMIGNFVNLFYLDAEGHLLAQYGMPGDQGIYSISDNIVTLFDVGKLKELGYPAVNGELSIQMENSINYNNIDSKTANYMVYDEVKSQVIQNKLQSGEFYLLPFKYDIFNYNNTENSISQLAETFNTLLKQMLKKDISVDDLLEQYSNIADKYDIEGLLEKLSEKHN